MPSFRHQGQRIAYTEFAPGPTGVAVEGEQAPARRRRRAPAGRPLILIHGLLLSQLMHRPLARELALRGNRVITVDLLGHGASDRPRDMWHYSMRHFAEQVVALMDELDLAEAVVMGTSLGANTVLEMMSIAPERLAGAIVEMPVLDNALPISVLAFGPLLVTLTFGKPVMKVLQRVARAVPRRPLPLYANVVMDSLRQDPGPSGALLQGLFFGRIAPHRDERRTFQTPALIIGHRRDPIHPLSDAGMLAAEMPHAELLEASSLVELRLRPERLTGEIVAFTERVWAARGARAARRATG